MVSVKPIIPGIQPDVVITQHVASFLAREDIAALKRTSRKANEMIEYRDSLDKYLQIISKQGQLILALQGRLRTRIGRIVSFIHAKIESHPRAFFSKILKKVHQILPSISSSYRAEAQLQEKIRNQVEKLEIALGTPEIEEGRLIHIRNSVESILENIEKIELATKAMVPPVRSASATPPPPAPPPPPSPESGSSLMDEMD